MEENKQKYELTNFEYELLVFLQKEGYSYIGKDRKGEFEPSRLVVSDGAMSYHGLSDRFITGERKTLYLEKPFGKLFKFMREGKQLQIQEFLKNYEVIEDE